MIDFSRARIGKPTFSDDVVYEEASKLLKDAYGENAKFREGQYEAIEATMTRNRTLVVQKTGWGKSLVYFICAKLKKQQGKGITLVISPLLALMENQKEMARDKFGLACATLNSTSRGREREVLLEEIRSGKYDVIFTTPETLWKEDAQEAVSKLGVGLFVIDEVHCMSDWGHDFRLNYGKLGRYISNFLSNATVLATTATANDRVVEDLKKQLGENVYVSRGPLTRESLKIQRLELDSIEERYAWLLSNLPKLPGTGIIYCLTQRDCDLLAKFLNHNGISALSYHSGQRDESQNELVLTKFKNNEIKAIVATVKLGMGYDKGDVSFVIHYQMPSNIVSWYQQIGRAGRALDKAYVFLMHGREDNKIHDYFIESAFPEKSVIKNVLSIINSNNGVTASEILQNLDVKKSVLDKALYFLENDGIIKKDRSSYYPTTKNYIYPEEHYSELKDLKRTELAQMHELLTTEQCISQFALNSLNDETARPCGKCTTCTSQNILPDLNITEEARKKASLYLSKTQILPIKPKTILPCKPQYLDYSRIPREKKLQEGICLTKYGCPPLGELVREGKYSNQYFDDKLVEESSKVLRQVVIDNEIRHITFVPSLRSSIVKDFATRLARVMGLELLDLLEKSDAEPQKNKANSAHQFENAEKSFFVKQGVNIPRKVLLIDDMIDSGWTLTVCGLKLEECGCREVYPFALADTSDNN